MRWPLLILLVSFCPDVFSQKDIAEDTVHVNHLIDLSIKDQWTDPYRSLNYADQALMLATQINYHRGIARGHNLKGFTYWAFGDNELAIQSAHEALEIARSENFKLIEADSYYIMARGYMDLREKARAHESITTAERLAEEGKDFTQLSSIYNLKGVIYYNARKFDSALYMYNKAYEVAKNHNVDPINLPRIISNIGECYLDENTTLAFRYFTDALALAKKTNNKIAEASITSIIGHAQLDAKDIKSAEGNLQYALKLAQELGLRRVMRQVYNGLVNIRLQQGNGNEAVIYLQRYYAVRDSLLNTSKIRQIVELESKYEIQLREKNIQLLEDQKRIETIWRNLLIGLVLLLMAVSITVIRLQRFRYRKNREVLDLKIDQLNQQHEEAINKVKTLQVPSADDSILSADQRLLKQAISIVENHIGDSQLSVEKMAEEMNMSRTSLHRKLKSITGFPPSELIRSIRLRKAASLIASRADSASQIAHAVGFEDYSHFSKAFKKQFGVSPSEYNAQG